jgi:outer membrane protein assembly factor BamD (BamD/ComL family)
MKRIHLLLLILTVILFAGCKPSRNKSAEQIKTLETAIYSPATTTFEKGKADSLMTMYETFISRFPDDTLAPVYTFRAANIAMNMNDGTKSLEFFDRYITRYPDKPKAEVCLFFKGYVYENVLKNLDKAKETYLVFIEKYPKSQFADDAQMALQNLGKSPEEMFHEFELKQKADSTRRADSTAVLSGKKSGKKK